VDLANLPNSNYVLGVNGNYGPSWLAPLDIIDARLVKFSEQIDFQPYRRSLPARRGPHS